MREVLKSSGPLLPRRAVEISSEVAAALSVAHRSGLVHRDVKPGNILLAPDGTVKVTDFGIARAWNDSQELTKTGAVMGTATYFSPEQAQGHPADERSDIYSLGIVLFEMLTGRTPFRGDSPVAVAYQHVSQAAVAPSTSWIACWSLVIAMVSCSRFEKISPRVAAARLKSSSPSGPPSWRSTGCGAAARSWPPCAAPAIRH